MADDRYLERIASFLSVNYPQPDYRWNYSEDNSVIDGSWLFATPVDVFGRLYSQFYQAVQGNGDVDFGLASCTANTQESQCVALNSTVKNPADTKEKLLVGHSYEIYEEIYNVMISADQFLDFTTLTIPTGRFLAAFRNAITYLSNKPEGQRPIVRILYSNPLPDLGYPNDTASDFLKTITRDVDKSNKLEIYVAVFSSYFTSWNHAKIVAADGKNALVGGHNVWDAHYLGVNPVFDVSMKISGSTVLHAHDYVDGMWKFLIERNRIAPVQWLPAAINPYSNYAKYSYAKFVYKNGNNSIETAQLPSDDVYTGVRADLTPPAGGNIPVLAMGRKAAASISSPKENNGECLPILNYVVGASILLRLMFKKPVARLGEDDNSAQFIISDEPSDSAFLELIGLAQENIKMSLQSLSLVVSDLEYVNNVAGLFYYTYNTPFLVQTAKALQRGVKIYITLSNQGAVAGGLSQLEAPYFGESPDTVNYKFLQIMQKYLKIDEDTAKQLIDNNLSVRSFRYNMNEEKYPGNNPIPNHAKTIMVDDQVFYIGSQNQYYSNLNEFGYMVEDQGVSQQYASQYWNLLHAASQHTSSKKYDDSIENDEQVEAVYFILDSYRNRRLGQTFGDIVAQQADAAQRTQQDADDEMDKLVVLDKVISNAGYATNSRIVQEMSNDPFFQESTASPTPESDRFIRDLTTNQQLYSDFSKCVADQYDQSPEDANDNINNFLHTKGYDCTSAQVYTSFTLFKGFVFNYWTGSYDQAWVIDDGGQMFSFDKSVNKKSAKLDDAESQFPSDIVDNAYVGEVLSVDKSGNVVLGGIPIKKPVFQNGTLIWSAHDNVTSGKLVFSEVMRESMVDGFVGFECYGTITYPDDGISPLQGKVSYYARFDKTNQENFVPTGWIIGAASLGAFFTLVAVISLVAKKISDNKKWEAVGRSKKSDDLELEQRHFLSEDEIDSSIAEQNAISVAADRAMLLRQRQALEDIAQYKVDENVESMVTTNKSLFDRISDLPTDVFESLSNLRGMRPDISSLNSDIANEMTSVVDDNILNQQGEAMSQEEVDKFVIDSDEYDSESKDLDESPWEDFVSEL